MARMPHIRAVMTPFPHFIKYLVGKHPFALEGRNALSAISDCFKHSIHERTTRDRLIGENAGARKLRITGAWHRNQ